MLNEIEAKRNTVANLFEFGHLIGTATTDYYKNLPPENQQPFYLDAANNKYRVHHGLAGLVLSGICLVGMCFDNDSIKALSVIGLGVGTALIKDDIGDIDIWFSDFFRR
jgi:uncharacterized membrane protein